MSPNRNTGTVPLELIWENQLKYGILIEENTEINKVVG
ncbi:hypothetical protein STRCR_2211 [Streptococcus criceti HS-6]|uniref:Uncharacterized protein n=1 Tax=Streptococcus criceti HS-6 TaxID=873449 RepID=G5JSL0_STRCG|nr:hypothetical protein STRCR_2211 [Streptococcus criceti HS-6]